MSSLEPLFHPEDLPEELITRTATMSVGPDGLQTTKTTVSMWYADEDLEPLMLEVANQDLRAFLEGVSFALQYFISVPETKPETPTATKEAERPRFVRPRHIEEPVPEDDIPF